VLAGNPLLAEGQIGVLQPLNALFLLPIPPYRTLTLFVTLHYTLAALFTYLLVRLLGLGRAGATLGGLSFGFGGFLMAQVTNLNIMSGAAWLPLVLAAFVWALQTRRPAVALLGGVPLALHIFAAQPQIPFYTTLLLVGYALFESTRLLFSASFTTYRRWTEAGRVWFLFFLMFGCGLLLAAPQIWPSWELQRYSVRSAGLSFDQIVIFSMPPVQWIALMLPNVFGTTVSGYHGLAGNYEEMNVFIGIIPLLMVALSWRNRRRSELIFFWLVVLLAVWLSMGGYTPLYELLQHLPVFNLIRAPTRWSLVATFALSVLAAYGFDAFVCCPGGRRLRYGLIGFWVMATIVLLVVWFFKEPLFQWADARPVRTDLINAVRELSRRGLFEIPDEYKGKIILGSIPLLITPAVALITRLGVGIALMTAYSAGRMSSRVFVVTMIAAIAIDMALAGGTAANPITDAAHWAQLSGGADYIQDQTEGELTRFYSVASSKEPKVVAGLKHYYPSLSRLFASGGRSPVILERYNTVLEQTHPLLRLALTGTGYVLNEGRLTPDVEATLPLAYHDNEWYVYEYPEVPPRAFVGRNVRVVNNENEMMTFLSGLEGLFNPQELLLLETDKPLPAISTEVAGGDEVVITEYTPSTVNIEVNLSGSGFLVLLDNFYPGWRVYIDDQPAEIVRAYSFARAVFLAEGHHTVQFVYRPRSFYGGAGLALFALVVWVWAAWRVWRRPSRQPAPGATN
jgi:hypothetical protein